MNKRKSIIFIIVFNILVGTTYVVTQLAAKESHHDGHNHEMGKMDHHVAGPGTQPPEAEGSPGICPVMRKKAGMEYSYEYKGKKYYFCCSACIEKFKNDPEKYISKMKEINFEAYQFGFSPEQITVSKGDIVKIHATSRDVPHGIYIKEYNVKVPVKKGEIQQIEFVADKTGEFDMLCSIYCGRGHHSMKAKLIVVE